MYKNIEDIKNKVVPIAQAYGVERLAMFGSYAKGAQTKKSDIDFLIKKGKIKGLFAFCGFINSLEDKLGVPVDVLTYEQLPNTLFMDDVLKDEVLLYSAEE